MRQTNSDGKSMFYLFMRIFKRGKKKDTHGWAFDVAVKMLLRMPTSNIGVPGSTWLSPNSPDFNFLLLFTQRGTGDGSSSWLPDTHKD